MRQILINSICGGVLGVVLPPMYTPGWWIGMVAAGVAIVNSSID